MMKAMFSHRNSWIMLGVAAVLFTVALFSLKYLMYVTWVVTWTFLLATWAWRTAEVKSRRILLIGLCAGISIRLIFLWLVYDYPYTFTDQRLYWYLGHRLSDLLTIPRAQELTLSRALGTATGMLYYFWVALHASVISDQFFVSLSNLLLGSASGILTYKIGRAVWSERVGMIAAWLVWFSSSMFLIDVLNLRDGMATFAVLSIIFGAQELCERWDRRGIFWFMLGMAILLQVRNYIAILLIVVVAGSLLIARREHRLRLFIIMAVISAVLGVFIATVQLTVLMEKLGEGTTLLDLLMWAHLGLVGGAKQGSAVEGVHLTSFTDIVLFLPVGLAHVLVAPLPWNPIRIDMGFVPETIIRYFSVPFLAIGIWDTLRTRMRRSLVILASALSIAMLYSALELGGNVRHHLQFFPVMYILISHGWVVARRYQFEIVLCAALFSLTIWGYGISSLRFTEMFFSAVLLLVAVWCVVAAKWVHSADSPVRSV
jgi:hypothetical protein